MCTPSAIGRRPRKPAGRRRCWHSATIRSLLGTRPALCTVWPDRRASSPSRYRARPASSEGSRTRSKLEKEFVRWLEDRGIPVPLLDEPFGPYTVDGIWTQAGLVVEVDTYETQGTRHSFEVDRRRDAYLLDKGLRTIRVTPQTWRRDGDRLARQLRRELAADLGQ